MLLELFLEGLSLAMEGFQMATLETRMAGIEKKFSCLSEQSEQILKEVEKVKKIVDNQSNFRIDALRDSSMRLLGKIGKANGMNADIISYFVASMGSHITAITFKGKRKQRENFRYGLQTYRGFMTGTQTPERIFQTLLKLQEVTEITGGKIITGCVTSKENMKAVAFAITAFFKIASLFDIKLCCLTDDNVNISNDTSSKSSKPAFFNQEIDILIQFEGQYSLSSYESVSTNRNGRMKIIKNNRKNIYILGPNGAGKSSWGNIISGENTFEVGKSNHTTMIPQPCDVESSFGFRLWDTPGLFDGSEEQGLMEDHMTHIIDLNGYSNCVLFVFPGASPANESTGKILQYAVDKFGEFIKKNFVAVINDFYGQGEFYRATYSEILYYYGFVEDGTNVFVSSAIDQPNKDCNFIRNKLGQFEPKLVAKHYYTYQKFMNTRKGDLSSAVRNLYYHGKSELENLLRRGRIETVRYNASGPRKNTSLPKDVILFRQHTRNYFFRKLGIGKDTVVEEKSVVLRGSAHFLTLIRAQLNQEYTIGEVNIFVKHILSEDRYILIHTPKSNYDYELRDATSMSNEEVQDLIVSYLVNEVKMQSDT